MIINMEVPVVNSKGKIVYEQRSILTETVVGQKHNVIPQLAALYAASKEYRDQGATVSFIHTHRTLEKVLMSFPEKKGKPFKI